MREIIFEVTEAPEGGYDARALGHSVFTQGDDWDDLRETVRDAVLGRCGGRGDSRMASASMTGARARFAGA